MVNSLIVREIEKFFDSEKTDISRRQIWMYEALHSDQLPDHGGPVEEVLEWWPGLKNEFTREEIADLVGELAESPSYSSSGRGRVSNRGGSVVFDTTSDFTYNEGSSTPSYTTETYSHVASIEISSGEITISRD